MKKFTVPVLLLVALHTVAQEKAFIRLASPSRENNAVRSPRQYLSGATCRDCGLTINGKPVKVYPTGAFAHGMDMQPGVNTFELIASGPGKTTALKKLVYQYTVPVPDTLKEFGIADISIFPEGNLVVAPGDKLRFKVKALQGCKVT